MLYVSISRAWASIQMGMATGGWGRGNTMGVDIPSRHEAFEITTGTGVGWRHWSYYLFNLQQRYKQKPKEVHCEHNWDHRWNNQALHLDGHWFCALWHDICHLEGSNLNLCSISRMLKQGWAMSDTKESIVMKKGALKICFDIIIPIVSFSIARGDCKVLPW